MRRFQAKGISDASSLGSCEVIRDVANGLFYRLHCTVVLDGGFEMFFSSPLRRRGRWREIKLFTTLWLFWAQKQARKILGHGNSPEFLKVIEKSPTFAKNRRVCGLVSSRHYSLTIKEHAIKHVREHLLRRHKENMMSRAGEMQPLLWLCFKSLNSN